MADSCGYLILIGIVNHQLISQKVYIIVLGYNWSFLLLANEHWLNLLQLCLLLGFSPLPHSLHSDHVEVCLISKEESSKTKEMLKAKGVTVKKVCLACYQLTPQKVVWHTIIL